jgi:hypothetical protein
MPFFEIRQDISCDTLATVHGSWIMLHGTKLNKEGTNDNRKTG